MTNVAGSRFVYVTYIRTTAEKAVGGADEPDFAEKYWRGARPVAHWKPGGAWKPVFPDGRVGDMGEIVEFEPGKAPRDQVAQRIQAGIQGRGLDASPRAKRSS